MDENREAMHTCAAWSSGCTVGCLADPHDVAFVIFTISRLVGCMKPIRGDKESCAEIFLASRQESGAM